MSKSLTGGILNVINEKYNCSSKKKTLAVMNLIRYHNPTTKNELEFLIASHQSHEVHSSCPCGSVSSGTIQDFGANLFEANKKYFADDVASMKTQEECTTFMYHLFITNSLKGQQMEATCNTELNAWFKRTEGFANVTSEMGNEEDDFKYSVDLVIKVGTRTLCGIQVKPQSYLALLRSSSIVKTNERKNAAYGYPVHYIYYDRNNKVINSLGIVAHLLEELTTTI